MPTLYSKDYDSFLSFIKNKISLNKKANKLKLKENAIKELSEAGLIEKDGRPKKNMIIEPHLGW